MLLTGAPSAGLTPALSLVVLRAFAAALIGGLDSVAGALVGGLVVGMVEAVVTTYQEQLSFLGLGLSDVAAFLVMFVVLLVRPQGSSAARWSPVSSASVLTPPRRPPHPVHRAVAR